MDEKRSGARKASTGLLFACFAIACHRLVYWSTSSGLFAPTNGLLNFVEIAAQVVAMLALIVIDWRLAPSWRLQHFNRLACMCVAAAALFQLVGSGLLFAPYLFPKGFSLTGFAVCGAVFRGLGSAVMLLGLGRFLCSISPEKSALVIAGGYASFGLVSLILSFTSTHTVALTSLFFPLGSGFCLILCNKGLPISAKGAKEKTAVDVLTFRKIPIDTVMLLFLCALAGVVSGAFASPGIVDPKTFNMMWAGIYLMVFLAYCIWVFQLKRKDPDSLWPFLVLIIFSGLFFYSSFSAIDLKFAASFMGATRRVLMLFCWVFIAAVIYRQKLPIFLFFGVGNLLFSQFPAMIGCLIEILHPHPNNFEASLVNTVSTAVMALALVVGIIIVLMRRRAPQNVLSSADKPADASERAMARIASEYELSPREVEIALLIVKGYTLPMVGEKLYISTDAVRSHSKKLYKKLDIHKKRDLIALVERYS